MASRSLVSDVLSDDEETVVPSSSQFSSLRFLFRRVAESPFIIG